jgi:hypothetical protein
MSKRSKKRIVDVRYSLPGGVGELPSAPTKSFAIGIPSYGWVSMDFIVGLLDVVHIATAQKLLRGIRIARSLQPDVRNFLVRWFLDETDAQWLLQVDDDMAFTTRDVGMLLEAGDPYARPIVSGLIYQSDEQVAWWSRDQQGRVARYYPRTLGLHRLARVGAAFLLVHRRVFEAMRKAGAAGESWIWFGRDDNLRLTGENSLMQRAGEDTSFCRRAEELGFSIWGDSRVQVGHLKVTRIDFESVRQRGAGLLALWKHGAAEVARWSEEYAAALNAAGDWKIYSGEPGQSSMEKAEAPEGSPGPADENKN